MLTHLHHSGPLSRASLTRRLGLNRSTTGALVSELVSRDLVFETASVGRVTVGRPSPLVHANPKIAALAVNPDVDAIIVGLVGLGGVVHHRVRHEAKAPPTVGRMVTVVRNLVAQLKPHFDDLTVVGLGLAVPGLVLTDEGLVTLAPHLNWHEEPLAQRITRSTGYPSFAGNDANLGMIAETLYGAGKNLSNLVYLNGSASGIGAGVLVDSRPLRGSLGYGAELGHTLINSQGKKCYCGKRGCLETEVNLARLLSIIGREHLDADELELTLSSTKDKVLKAEMRRQVNLLAQAIAGFMSVFNPEAVLLGGFLGSLYSAMSQRLHDTVAQLSLSPLRDCVRIGRAQLGSHLLVVGAAELAFQPLLADPGNFSPSGLADRDSE